MRPFQLLGIAVVLVAISGSALATQTPEPRKVDAYGAIACDDAMARLDNFALKLQEEPAASGYIVVYPDRTGLVGKLRSYLDFPKTHLQSSRGIPPDRLTTLVGEYREKMTTELWISSGGLSPTITAGAIETDFNERWKFDEDFADYAVQDGKAELWTYDLCDLGAINPVAFAEQLLSQPNSRGLLVVHLERGKSSNRFRTMARLLRAEMVKAKVEPRRFTIRAGARRKIPTVELWVLPG